MQQISVLFFVCNMGLISAQINFQGGGGGGLVAPPPLTNCKCGVANGLSSRIVGGTFTEKNKYPWQVGLTSRNGNSPYCGGSLISNKEVLTAAHCNENKRASDIFVLLGEHDVTFSDGELKVTVCGVANHPNYNPRTNDYDFAVLTLCDTVTFTRTIRPVCLPPSSRHGSRYERVNAIVSGWGATLQSGSKSSKLMEVGVKTMSNAQCTASNTIYRPSQVTDRMICAANPGKDSCQGDSGGPLVTKSGISHFLIGVVSWGSGCAKD